MAANLLCADSHGQGSASVEAPSDWFHHRQWLPWEDVRELQPNIDEMLLAFPIYLFCSPLAHHLK